MLNRVLGAGTIVFSYYFFRRQRTFFFVNLFAVSVGLAFYVGIFLALPIPMKSIPTLAMLTQGLHLGHELYCARAPCDDIFDNGANRSLKIALAVLTMLWYMRADFDDMNPFWFVVRYNALDILSRTRHYYLQKTCAALQIVFLYLFYGIFLFKAHSHGIATMTYGFVWLPWQVSRSYTALTEKKHSC